MATTNALFPFDFGSTSKSISNATISSSTTKTGFIAKAPKAGNLRYIGLSTSTNTGSPALDLRIEGVTSTVPNTTLWATNTNVAYSPVTTNALVWKQLTADAVVAAGDLFAVVVGYTSGTSAVIPYRTADAGNGQILPLPVNMTAGTWATQQGNFPANIGVKYDDGTIVRGCIACSTITSNSFQSGSSPNEYASVFTAPFGATLIGVRVLLTIASASTAFTINLYSGTSTSATATITVAAADCPTATGFVTLFFSSPITLTSGTDYRLSIKATAAANVTVHKVVFPSTAERDATYGELWSDTRAGSSWIGASTVTTELVFPIFGSVTSSVIVAEDD